MWTSQNQLKTGFFCYLQLKHMISCCFDPPIFSLSSPHPWVLVTFCLCPLRPRGLPLDRTVDCPLWYASASSCLKLNLNGSRRVEVSNPAWLAVHFLFRALGSFFWIAPSNYFARWTFHGGCCKGICSDLFLMPVDLSWNIDVHILPSQPKLTHRNHRGGNSELTWPRKPNRGFSKLHWTAFVKNIKFFKLFLLKIYTSGSSDEHQNEVCRNREGV